MISKSVQTSNASDNQVHDKSFKRFFSKRIYVQELLKVSLPKRIICSLNLKTLRLISNPPSEGLKELFMDLLFEIQLKGSNVFAKIVLLFEHKSIQEKDLLWQLFKYQIRLYEQHKVPILPIVVYTGKNKEWKQELSFQAHLALQNKVSIRSYKILNPYVLDFNYVLFNLPKFDIANKLSEDSLLVPILHTFQKIRLLYDTQKRDYFLKNFLFAEKVSDRYKLDIINRSIIYFRQYKKDLSLDMLRKISKDISKEGGKNTMEILDYTMEDLAAKSRKEGIQETKHNIILGLLKDRIDISTIAKATEVSKEEVLKIQKEAGL